MNRIFFAAIGSLLLFSSCHFLHHREKGSGNVIQQSRNVSNFTGVHISSAMELYIKQDSATSVKVETDDNLQRFIIVWEENGVLHIKQEDNTSLDNTGQIKVYVSAPQFSSIKASGACNIYSQNMISSPVPVEIGLSGASGAQVELKSPRVSADLSGASSIALRGETKQFSIDGSGSSNVKCFDLMTEETTIEMSGASDAEVFASVKLDVKASGASDVRYKGNASVSQNVSGAGSVKKVQ